MDSFSQITELLKVKSMIEERIALLQACSFHGVYILNRGTDNWILIKNSGCTTQYVGNIPNGPVFYWPEPQCDVLASAQYTGATYCLDQWDFNQLEFVSPSDYPLYLSNVSIEFENMMKDL